MLKYMLFLLQRLASQREEDSFASSSCVLRLTNHSSESHRFACYLRVFTCRLIFLYRHVKKINLLF